MTTFDELVTSARERSGLRASPSLADTLRQTETLLCLDPGDTTGYAVFDFDPFFLEEDSISLRHAGQVEGVAEEIDRILRKWKPNTVVAESYHIYQSKLQAHTHSDVPTLRLIGAIEYLCRLHNIKMSFQTAQTAKAFCTDPKLKEWGFYQKGKRHANDAIRHGAYYLIFGSKLERAATKTAKTKLVGPGLKGRNS